MTPATTEALLQAWEATRRRLPGVERVTVRPNRSRLASLSRHRGKGTVLNVARSVVEAGPEAWALLAPALEGDRQARRLLREVVGRVAPEEESGSGARRATPCQGTPPQRELMEGLLAHLRVTAPHGDLIPHEVELRISTRMTSTLGVCRRMGRRYRITLAERLFRRGLEEILDDTLRHEVAHLVHMATSPDGRSNHGAGWREWARRFGARPERLCSAEDGLKVRITAARRGPEELPETVLSPASHRVPTPIADPVDSRRSGIQGTLFP